MKTPSLILALLLLCGAASAAVPSSINNDDSCDVKVGPAATLLLPYFEIDVSGTSGQTTLFTVTNVTRYPQIAHVTLWTDFAFPVLTFNGGSAAYSVTHYVLGGQQAPTNAPTSLAPAGSTTTVGPRPSQNWVTVTMFGNAGPNRLTAEFDAASLGNGCSPAAFVTVADGGAIAIGPAGGVFVCPPGTTLTGGSTAQCTGTNENPPP